MTIHRTANWLEISPHENVFYWLHTPKLLLHNHAYIIVGAIGPEYMHTYRSIRLLADQIARAGNIAVRYDHAGMGNSSSNLIDSGLWNNWTQTPIILRQYIAKQFGIENFTVMAFRSGSLLIDAYNKKYNDKEIIFWYPYLQGAAFVRDMKLLDSKQHTNSTKPFTLEAGGYPLSEENQQALLKVNLLKQEFNAYHNALVIENGELSNKSFLSKNLKIHAKETTTKFLLGLSTLCRQAELSIMPIDNIEVIYNWIKALPTNSKKLQQVSLPEREYLKENSYTEKQIIINSETPIFGILSLPNNQATTKLLILTNSGSGHHVGPNRFHVNTARELVKQGIAVFRTDLSNIGDSPKKFINDSYQPYPKNAAQDINTVVEYFESLQSFKKIAIAGLCSGAHNAFHGALKNTGNALRGLILINIITFSWKEGQSILVPEDSEMEINANEYQNNIFDITKWLGLFKTPSKLPRLVLFVIKALGKKSLLFIRKFLLLFGYRRLTKLDKDLYSITSRDINIHFLYAENEPTYSLLMSQANISTSELMKKDRLIIKKIKNAGHTFSTQASQKKLINSIIESAKALL